VLLCRSWCAHGEQGREREHDNHICTNSATDSVIPPPARGSIGGLPSAVLGAKNADAKRRLCAGSEAIGGRLRVPRSGRSFLLSPHPARFARRPPPKREVYRICWPIYQFAHLRSGTHMRGLLQTAGFPHARITARTGDASAPMSLSGSATRVTRCSGMRSRLFR
jgi:hypothetical protein